MDDKKPDTEYQLTEKGKQLAAEVAKKTTEKDKAQTKIQESTVGQKPLSSTELKKQLAEVNRKIKEVEDLEKQKKNEWVKTNAEEKNKEESSELTPEGEESSGEHRYDKAKRIRKAGFGNLMADKLLGGQGIGESFKKTLSETTKAKMTGIKEFFDPMNAIKKLTGGSRLAPALLGRITGRSQEDIEHRIGKASPTNSVGETATKVGKVDSVSDGMTDILTKILTLMQKSYDEDKLASEESKSKEEETTEEKERKNKAMLDALKSKKGAKGKGDAEEKIEKETGGGIGDFIKQLLDGFGGMKTLLNIGKFFMGPVGIAILGAASLGALFYAMAQASPEAHDQASKVQNAGDVSAEGAAITEVKNDEASNRKATLLREAHKNGTIKAPWYNFKQQGKEEQEYLKAIGFDPKTGLTQKDRDNGFNAVDEDGNPYRSKTRTATPMSKDESTKTLATTPAETPSSGSNQTSMTATDTGNNQAVPPTATPEDAASSLGSQLAGVTGENLDSKLGELSAGLQKGLETVTNNVINKSVNTPGSAPIPSVRNSEETFQRMIWNSTRVV